MIDQFFVLGQRRRSKDIGRPKFASAGRATFGNAGCVTGDAGALRLNAVERANTATILQAERAKGCAE